MNDDLEFKKAYREYADKVSMPDNLQDEVMATVESSRNARRAKEKTGESARDVLRERASDSRIEVQKRRKATHSFGRFYRVAAVTACGVLAIVLAAPILIANMEDRHDGMSSISSSSSLDGVAGTAAFLENAGFTIKAYAENDGNVKTIMPNEDNLIIFDPNGNTSESTFWIDDSGNRVYANFQADTFTVEGEGIERIQMNISKGELYAQITELVDKDENPELYVGEEGLDPILRGKREHYENVDMLASRDHLSSGDSEHASSLQDVFLMKRIGRTVDAKKADDSRVGTNQIQFGFLEFPSSLYSEGEALSAEEIVDGDGRNISEKGLQYKDEFDGAVLAVTVTFDDGHCETQMLELHTGLVAADEDGATVQPIRFFDANKGDTTGNIVKYATLFKESTEAFPYSELPANEYASVVMPSVPDDIDPWREE